MKLTITHDAYQNTFTLTDDKGAVLDTDMDPNKLAKRAWDRDPIFVRHNYDLKLAEWKGLPEEKAE